MATTYYNDIQKLYVAYFNRPADPTGLTYWEGVIEKAGTDPKAIAAAEATMSANFAASTEYTANFTGMSNADIVNTVYMNLFGRPADDSGKKFYADALTAGKLSIAAVVTEVAKGAQGSDMTAYNNKVTAATAFTAALTSSDSYNTQLAATAAKAFLSGVTDNTSLANAIDPVMLQVSIAKVDAAAQPFSLQTGLATLTAANAAHTAFLAAADGDNNAKTSTTDAAINNAVDPTYADSTTTPATPSAAKVVADLVNAHITEGAIYATASASVQAALLAEAQANEATQLSTDQAKVTADNAAIAKVAGLGDAMASLSAAKDAATAAATADTAAHTDVALKIAAYNVLNTSAITAPTTGYAVSGLIDASSKGVLSLHAGVTETTNPGVTALLNSLTAEQTADANVTSTTTAQTNAQALVDFLDLNATALSDLKAVAADMTLVKVTAGTLPNQAQITTELSGLLAIKTSADAIAAQSGATADQIAAGTAADNAYTTFKGLVDAFNAANTDNPNSATLTSDNAAVKADQKAITDLSTAVANLAKATTLQAELNAVNGQVKAASDAFTTNGMAQPVTLDASHASPLATGAADIYVAGTTNATITNFGLVGADALYLGSKYTLNTTGDTTKGNDSVLEAFIVKSGSDTKIVLETKAFASSEATTADLVTITLTGVDSTHVHLTNGIITVS